MHDFSRSYDPFLALASYPVSYLLQSQMKDVMGVQKALVASLWDAGLLYKRQLSYFQHRCKKHTCSEELEAIVLAKTSHRLYGRVGNHFAGHTTKSFVSDVVPKLVEHDQEKPDDSDVHA